MSLAARELAKFSMSLEELAACEDFLDGHREYATDLLSDIEAIRRWHKSDICPPETRDGQPCSLCELCDDNGLLGATKRVLETYEDADNHLKQVRASLNASGRGGASPHTLFTSPLAKAVFLGVVSVGEALRSQHATWSVRLQSIVASMSMPAPSSGDADKHRKGRALPPANAGPTIADPKLSASAPGFAPELTSNASMFLVSRRCLAGDCCCDAGGSHAAFRVPPPPPVSKKTSKPKATQSLATNRFKKASDTLAQPSADPQTYTRAFDTPSLQGVIPGAHPPSSPALDATTSTQETDTFSSSPECEELIVDPRVFRLRSQLVRSNVACRALMDWCQAWLNKLQLDPLETGPTDESITRCTHVSSTLSLDYEKADPQRLRHTTSKATTRKLSRNDAAGQEVQFNSQEKLKERWLTARRKRSQRPEMRYGSRLKVSK